MYIDTTKKGQPLTSWLFSSSSATNWTDICFFVFQTKGSYLILFDQDTFECKTLCFCRESREQVSSHDGFYMFVVAMEAMPYVLHTIAQLEVRTMRSACDDACACKFSSHDHMATYSQQL